MRVLSAEDVRRAVDPAAALQAVREAFVSLAEGRAVSPPNFELVLAERRGELHVKGGYIRGGEHFAVKLATGFYDNPSRGLPVAGGMSLVLSAVTGEPIALVLDEGLLTELRTAAAGALAADLLARRDIRRVAVVGAGGQARHQLAALLGVRAPSEIVVVARRAEAAHVYAVEMSDAHGVAVHVADGVESAVREADIIITTTPAPTPVLAADWVKAGAHITAVGSDMPHKNEVEPILLARVDKLVVDSIESAARAGELHHALDAGLLSTDDVYAQLGAVAAGQLPGRENDHEITLCDLTGLGVQDVAISELLAQRAETIGLGYELVLDPTP